MTNTRFRVDSSSVVYETFDEELVAIHLSRGSYHSMSGAGTDAFLLLLKEATTIEVSEALAAKYAASPGEIVEALGPFIEQLLEQELIQPVDSSAPATPLRVEAKGERLPFEAPVLEAFNDLEGLLLLDPIHEVGEEGWPAPPDSSSK